MNVLRSISIIVSIDKKKLSVSSYIDSIRNALRGAKTLHNKPIRYEIIFVTNDVQGIALEDIEVFPHFAQISVRVEKKQQSNALLFAKRVANVHGDIIIALDAHFLLPPATLSKIIRRFEKDTDVVVAFPRYKSKNGNKYNASFQTINHALLLSVQKNPKAEALVFTREVWETIKSTKFTDKTFTIEFLLKSLEAGFTVARYDIYHERQNILIPPLATFGNTIAALFLLLLVRLKKFKPIMTPPTERATMLNAGVRYKKQHFVTHSTLSPKESAIDSLTLKQISVFTLFVFLVVLAVRLNVILFAQVVFASLSILYGIDAVINIILVYKAIRGSSEITFTSEEFSQLRRRKMPMYTILCPLYKEAHMLEQFLAGIAKLAWPRDKLDVIVLLEEDDVETIQTMQSMKLPSYVRSLVVPDSQPKTKPKACNYGLAFAKGEYVVIFDAEDIPDPLQLQKAYIGFQKSERNIVCLQAKLNYHNVNQNLLTRFFTAEYSWFFDVALPGLQALHTIIPLGGTSNHFRRADLVALNGWDPFNVTEDADLGWRIFRMGYRTAIIDSVTLEEANSNVKNWIRQRSRWIKGYMQTYLVHMREILPTIKQNKLDAFLPYMIMGGRILFIFVNPILWIITITYFTIHGIFGAFLERAYPPAILYIASLSLVFGNYVYILGYVWGCVKREQWGLIKYVYLTPFYMLLISIAGFVAFYQLIFKPYYWEKTIHGLNQEKQTKKRFSIVKTLKNTLPHPSRVLT